MEKRNDRIKEKKEKRKIGGKGKIKTKIKKGRKRNGKG